MIYQEGFTCCGTGTLCTSREPQHHRIFWKEETTAASVWEGAHQALGPRKLSETDENSKTNDNFKDDGGKTNGHQRKGQQIFRHYQRQSSAAALLAEVSTNSNLRRLSDLLNEGTIDYACPTTFADALKNGNPAVVEMILHRGHRNLGGGLFRSLGGAGSYDPSPQCTFFPLHACCLAGSPEIVSVLLTFIDKSFSKRVERRLMVNARDSNGRTALHLASWSPQPHCPGRRHGIIRHLLDGEIRKHVPLASYMHMHAKIIARSYVTRFMHRFERKCDQCRARSLFKCEDQKRREFPTWLYKHKRWPKSVEGEQQQVRPSAVEMAS